MSVPLPIALVQTGAAADAARFGSEVERLAQAYSDTKLFLYPELHLSDLGDLTGDNTSAAIRANAESADGPRDQMLRQIAGDLGIWLLPGSFYERGDDDNIHNSTALYGPDGSRSSVYRKVFPWRPFESTVPGTEFVVADMGDYGRVGLSICYDSWYPESTRHLAWMGADLILNVVRTPTADRAQEATLARANAIANQVYFASVNAASPSGTGRSLLVDPQGRVLVESASGESAVLTDVIDLSAARTVREHGTAGVTRPWAQFTDADAPIDLPLYSGQIHPSVWNRKR